MLGTGGFVKDETKRNAAQAFQTATQSLILNKAMENISGPKKLKSAKKAPYIKGKKGDLERLDIKEDEVDEDNMNFDDDDEFNRIRQQRLVQLKEQAKMEQQFKVNGHGKYNEVFEENFLKEVTGSKYVVCHFYHRDFERCKIVDKHLNILSVKHISTKFIKINAEKAPFFVSKLQIRLLPTIVCFIDGIAKDRIVGFEELGARDDFSTETLAERLREAEVIA